MIKFLYQTDLNENLYQIGEVLSRCIKDSNTDKMEWGKFFQQENRDNLVSSTMKSIESQELEKVYEEINVMYIY